MDSTAAKDSGRRIVIKGTAGPGDKIKLSAETTWADSSGRWSLTHTAESEGEADSALTLCLQRGTREACSTFRPGAFDTLELAPLRFSDSTASASADSLPAATDSVGEPAAEPVLVDDSREAPGRRVVVKGRRRYRAPGQESISVQDSKRLPGLGEPDVIRAVQAQAGVTASSDFSTKLYVRGSPSDQNLILLDNAVVYSPAHFGGLFSSFLADATGGMNFYKGGFEPRYGNRLSSLLKIDSKTGGEGMDSANLGNAFVQGAARISLFSGSLETDGRNGNWSWTLGGRRMWWDKASDLFRYLAITDFSLDYHFYDLQGNVAWGNQGDTVKVSLYKGEDNLDFSPLLINWGNTVVPLNVRKRVSDVLVYNGTLAYSEFFQEMAMSDIINTGNSVKSVSSRQEFEYAGIANHLLTAGYEYDWYWIDFHRGSRALGISAREKYGLPLHAGYIQDRWTLYPRNTVTLGLRGYYYEEIDHTGWDPRLAYIFMPADHWRIDFSIGRYTQYLTSIRLGDTENFNELWYALRGPMKPTTSVLTAAGVERSALGNLRLNVSLQGYYKEIRNIPLYYPNQSAGETGAQDNRSLSLDFSKLDGYSMGVELGVRRDQGVVSGELSYGLSQAALQQSPFHTPLRNADFAPYYADWDQRHTFKASATINWKGDGMNSIWKHRKNGYYLRSQFQMTYHTGQPYTGYDNFLAVHEPSQGIDGSIGSGLNTFAEGNVRALPGLRNNSRMPYYMRLDLTVIERGQEGKWRSYWSILNVLNRENAFAVQIDPSSNPPKKTFVNQLPLIPIFFGFEYEF